MDDESSWHGAVFFSIDCDGVRQTVYLFLNLAMKRKGKILHYLTDGIGSKLEQLGNRVVGRAVIEL